MQMSDETRVTENARLGDLHCIQRALCIFMHIFDVMERTDLHIGVRMTCICIRTCNIHMILCEFYDRSS